MEKSKLTKCCSPVIFQEGKNDEICVFFIFSFNSRKSVSSKCFQSLNSELQASRFHGLSFAYRGKTFVFFKLSKSFEVK